MKSFIILTLTIIFSLSAKSQTIIADSSNFSFYNDNSQTFCEYGDATDLDLDEDGLMDLKFFRSSFRSSIGVYPQPGWGVLLGHYYSGALVTTKCVKYGDTINSQEFVPDRDLTLHTHFLADKTNDYISLGWNENSVGYVVLKKTTNKDTAYYLVKIKISNKGCCFQVIDNRSIETSNRIRLEKLSYHISFLGNKLNIFKNERPDEIQININDVQGKNLIRKRLNDLSPSIDISSLPRGIYFLSIYEKQNLNTFKFIKQ